MRRAAVGLALALALVALAAPSVGWSQQEPAASAQLLPSRDAFARGKTYPLAVVVTVAPGFHINGPAAGAAGMIPTRLSLTAPAGISLSQPRLPEPHKVELAFSDQPLEVYDGRMVARLDMQVADEAPLGRALLKAVFSYQACNDQVCHMPQRQELNLALEIVEHGREGARLHPEVFRP